MTRQVLVWYLPCVIMKLDFWDNYKLRKNDLIIVVIYGSLTEVRNERRMEGKNWICVDIKEMENRCIMKQKTLVILLITAIVILTLVLLGKGIGRNQNDQNSGDDSTNISWNVSGDTEIFREEDTELEGNTENTENTVTLDEERVIQEQSFNTELNEWGNVRFVSYLPSDEIYMEDVSFLLTKENQVVYAFPYYCDNNTTQNYIGLFDRVEAVGFQDVNHDRLQDVIVIINYVTGAGPQGMLPRGTVRIFVAEDNGFVLAEDMMNEIEANIVGTDMTIESIYKYIEEH